VQNPEGDYCILYFVRKRQQRGTDTEVIHIAAGRPRQRLRNEQVYGFANKNVHMAMIELQKQGAVFSMQSLQVGYKQDKV
jgi:hypothetical protein